MLQLLHFDPSDGVIHFLRLYSFVDTENAKYTSRRRSVVTRRCDFKNPVAILTVMKAVLLSLLSQASNTPALSLSQVGVLRDQPVVAQLLANLSVSCKNNALTLVHPVGAGVLPDA